MNHYDAIQCALVSRGWTCPSSPTGSTLATRQIDTACGPREIVLYGYPSGTLYGSYVSEGRNALATFYAPTRHLDPASIPSFVERLEREVFHTTDQTYARERWLHGVRPQPPITLKGTDTRPCSCST